MSVDVFLVHVEETREIVAQLNERCNEGTIEK